MSRRTECPAWKRALFTAGLLFASVQPLQGAVNPGGGEEDVASCCADPEGCCPVDEHRAPGQRYAPLCCGVDAPASTQEKPGTLPARTISDPTETVLRLFARCAKQASAQSWIPPAVDAGRIEPAHGPPLSGAAAPIEGHWLTERELGSALALLSVLRL